MSKAFVLSALSVVACALLRAEPSRPAAAPAPVERHVVHDGEETLVWDMRGEEVVGVTVYRVVQTSGVIEKTFYPVAGKKRETSSGSNDIDAIEIPPGGRYELKEGEPGRWVNKGIVNGSQEYEYAATGGRVVMTDKGNAAPLFVREGLEPGTRVRLSESRLVVLPPKSLSR